MKIEIIGVHELDHDDYEFMDTDPWFLFEVVITDVEGPFDFLFEQPDPSVDPGRWMVCYMPMLLDADGTRAIENKGDPINLDMAVSFPGHWDYSHLWRGTMRCVFFLFDYRTDLPIKGPTGELRVPPVSPLPDRLRAIAQHFVAPD